MDFTTELMLGSAIPLQPPKSLLLSISLLLFAARHQFHKFNSLSAEDFLKFEDFYFQEKIVSTFIKK